MRTPYPYGVLFITATTIIKPYRASYPYLDRSRNSPQIVGHSVERDTEKKLKVRKN